MDFKQAKENSEKNYNTLINKCWEDEAFKQELIDNPVQAIEKLSGKPFDTKGKKILVTDQTNSDTIHINIPVNPNDLELTEEQLEAVAGGGRDGMVGVEITWSLICVLW